MFAIMNACKLYVHLANKQLTVTTYFTAIQTIMAHPVLDKFDRNYKLLTRINNIILYIVCRYFAGRIKPAYQL